MPRSETLTRVAVAAAAIPLVVGAAYLGGWVLGVFLAAFAVLGAVEVYRLAAERGVQPFVLLGATGSAAFVLQATAVAVGIPIPVSSWSILVTLTLGALVAAIWLRGVDGAPLTVVAVTVFGALYTGGLVAFAILLRHLPGVTSAWHGTALVFAPVLLTWASDTSAYFTGRAFGRRKLIPQVSAGKTVEGAIGAILGTLLVAMLYSGLLARFDGYQLGIGEAAIFGVLISVAAQLGDLVESLLKRDARVKDSGTMFPGHGGVLDRLDSLLFTLPFAYFFFLALAAR